MLSNGSCDSECDNKECAADNGECTLCATGCYSNFINDGYCDEDCYNAACNYDGNDCLCSNANYQYADNCLCAANCSNTMQ
mmetsp:Transcript_26852/g.4889  ORF Transcript_26852/g.4889 Transcript_26852/m.4889 type:complete len:81 (+) Transcript_26852:307-549(+)